MVASAVLFVARAITKQEALAFWGETVGLVSFGVSWLMRAGHHAALGA
jgi:hypothetical protein